MRSSKELYGIDPKTMPNGFKEGLLMQLHGVKQRLHEEMQKPFMDRDDRLILDIKKAERWNEVKLEELKDER